MLAFSKINFSIVEFDHKKFKFSHSSPIADIYKSSQITRVNKILKQNLEILKINENH